MPPASAANLVDVLRGGWLLEPAHFQELPALQASFPDARALARELVRRGWLTLYQANALLQGHGHQLLLGSYVLLGKLGEGGMGQVFKARNWKLGRVVAVKLIRKERLANDAAVRRFQREIRAAAQLDHPNIVRAYDAGELAGRHFFVMEYVEGVDLARLLATNGPPPVAQACDYARQAALGLQHAFERGLVHRDIKPANLLLTTGGVIKLLDLGLARLAPAGDEGGGTSTVTQEGAVMGTPDYIAPEQALESHAVDVRADVYSLGCTLYHLLAGRPPFPGGTILQKLRRHERDEPTPLGELRPEVPARVAAVVGRMMAKRPEDRYQTPAEAAAALAGEDGAVAGGTALAAPAWAPAAVPSAAADTAPGWSELVTPAPGPATGSRLRRRRAAERRRLMLLSRAGAAVLLGLLGLLLAALWRLGSPAPRPEPAPQVTVAPVDLGALNFDDWCREVPALPAEKQLEAVGARLRQRNPAFDGNVQGQAEGGTVTRLELLTDHVSDIAPVVALRGLKALACRGSARGKGRLADLTPLKELRLTALKCPGNQVADLTPLAGMPLSELDVQDNPVTDLSPLRRLPLTSLSCDSCPVSDLSPLKGMRLTSLDCAGTRATDPTPLAGMPLESLRCNFNPWRDPPVLRPLKTLGAINGRPAAEFWKDEEAKQSAFDGWCQEVSALPAEDQVKAVAARLKERNPGFHAELKPTIAGGAVTQLEVAADELTDLAPVRALGQLKGLTCPGTPPGRAKLADLAPLHGMGLTSLTCPHTRVADLSPLRGMPLAVLHIDGTLVADLSPLRDVPHLVSLSYNLTSVADLSPLSGLGLTRLLCQGTQVQDLSPLKGMPLTGLACGRTPVKDLSPLKGMKLSSLGIAGTAVTDRSPLEGMPLVAIWCDVKGEDELAFLRSIKTLRQINGRPAAEVLKEAAPHPASEP
jgi:Leucine-rich repeat (LRR) protein/tRNA A-37 threonylcarbamoyl transferase component Bud32